MLSFFRFLICRFYRLCPSRFMLWSFPAFKCLVLRGFRLSGFASQAINTTIGDFQRKWSDCCRIGHCRMAAVHAKRFSVQTGSGSHRFRFTQVHTGNRFRVIVGSLGPGPKGSPGVWAQGIRRRLGPRDPQGPGPKGSPGARAQGIPGWGPRDPQGPGPKGSPGDRAQGIPWGPGPRDPQGPKFFMYL